MDKKLPKWLKTILIILATAWALRFPPTRMIITWLLPLGSGWDDFIIGPLLVIALLICFVKTTRFGSTLSERWRWIKEFFK